jgi:nucleoside-diphosphate-sugar epimerase
MTRFSVAKKERSSVLVLGAKGHLGQAAVEAFAAAGWRVIAQARSAINLTAVPNVETLECDALDTQTVIVAVGKVDVIVHAINPNYARWDTLLAPVTAAVIAIAKATGGMLMVPGNVYNFGTDLPLMLTENTPLAANNQKAALRIDMEQSIAAAAGQGVKSVVIRAGDFIGGSGTWLDMAITKSLHKNIVTSMGPTDLEHAWAYLPDLAEVFVRVAEKRSELGGHQVFHYAGITASGRELHQALESVTGRNLKLRPLPWWIFKILALFSPLLRAVLQMRYLWQRPHRLVGTKLDNFIGSLPASSLQEALAASLPRS